MGRKYGLLGYGKYSYDLYPSWKPIPVPPITPLPPDIWVPIPATPPVPPPPDIWASSVSPPISEIWVPIPPPSSSWNYSALNPTEIWVPVVFPTIPSV